MAELGKEFVMIAELDIEVNSPEKRLEIVNNYLAEHPQAENQPYILEQLANYLVFCMDKEEKAEHKIITQNRSQTIHKNESSFEDLAEKFENGEDGVYALVIKDRHVKLQPKNKITQKDIEEIPELTPSQEAADAWRARAKELTGIEAWKANKVAIEFAKERMAIKYSRNPPVQCSHLVRSDHPINFPEEIEIGEDDRPIGHGVTLLDPKICSIILCNYSALKISAEGRPTADVWYLMDEFDAIYEKAMRPHPLYARICEYKINQVPNTEIQNLLEEEFGIRHSIEYISSLWRNKIPYLISSAAEDTYLEWYYTFAAKGKFKRCSRCGVTKIANSKYFSKNNTSSDGWYSLCKECRKTQGKNKPVFEEADSNVGLS